jgi:hypothetical protein
MRWTAFRREKKLTAELFQTTVPNISVHIRKIFE